MFGNTLSQRGTPDAQQGSVEDSRISGDVGQSSEELLCARWENAAGCAYEAALEEFCEEAHRFSAIVSVDPNVWEMFYPVPPTV